MRAIKYFYADPAGTVHENPEVWPVEVLSKYCPQGIIFRFAYDPETDKFYVQDQSFRKLMASGDKDVWHFVNESVRFIKDNFGTGFLDREFGDPPGSSVKRTLSQYAPAWNYLTEFLREEINDSPVNISVCEFVPEKDGEKLISLELPGVSCGEDLLDEPCICLNRYMHRDEKLGKRDDVDWTLLNEVLSTFYLRNIREIYDISVHPDDADQMATTFDQHEDVLGYDLMVAYSANNDVRIIKASDNGFSEQDIRRAMPNLDLVVLFSYVPEQNRLIFHNHMPTDMAKHEQLGAILASVKKTVSKSSNVLPEDIVLSFDPVLCSPYVSKLSRYQVPWEIGHKRFGKKIRDLAVIEVPMELPKRAMLVRNGSEEPDNLKNFRVRYGMAVKYPFLAVDNRTHNLGLKYKAMLDALSANPDKKSDAVRWIEEDRGFIKLVRSEKEANSIQQQMEFMLRMGLPRTHIVDFYAERDEPVKRAEYRKIMRHAWDEAGLNAKFAALKTAAIGPSYDVNAWWHIGLQEDLNRARHENSSDNKKVLEPFNLRKVREKQGPKKRPYEALLNKQRDKNLNYLKSTEQLLGESRI